MSLPFSSSRASCGGRGSTSSFSCTCSTASPSLLPLWLAEDAALALGMWPRCDALFWSLRVTCQSQVLGQTLSLCLCFNSWKISESSLLHSCLKHCFRTIHCWEWPLTCGCCWWDGNLKLYQYKNGIQVIWAHCQQGMTSVLLRSSSIPATLLLWRQDGQVV